MCYASNGDQYVFGWDVSRKIMYWNDQIATMRGQLNEAIKGVQAVETSRSKAKEGEQLWIKGSNREPLAVEAAQQELYEILLM